MTHNTTNMEESNVNKILSVIMYLWGGMFTLFGILGILTGDILVGILVTLCGLVAIPSIHSKIGMAKDSHVTAFVISFVLLMAATMFMPETTPVTCEVTTEAIPETTPVTGRIYNDARLILPNHKEVGNGEGWSYKKGKYTEDFAAARYTKNDRTLTIRITIMETSKVALDAYMKRLSSGGMDGYPDLGVGDQSMYMDYSDKHVYGDQLYGIFVKDNALVTVDVEDTFLYEYDVIKYARNVEKKM